MTKDSGALSIDFIAGFTIFLIAFIWVISLIPGLLINLQGYTIDYDAVAYRTGVILVEDPGWPTSPPWETQQNYSVIRFGLAVSRDTPNILSQEKVDRFFVNSPVLGNFSYPIDYRERVIFGDDNYSFNISLYDVEKNTIQSVGDILPEGYGYIRRIVKIKGLSNASINKTYIQSHNFKNTENVTTHEFSILINNSKLAEQKDPSYQIDPSRDQIVINITDLRSTIFDQSQANSINITLTDYKVYKQEMTGLTNIPSFYNPYYNGTSASPQPLPAEVNDSVSLKFNPAFFDSLSAGSSNIYINLSFNLSKSNVDYPSTFLNNTWSSPFDYDYDAADVTQPQLRDAEVEVAVW